MVRRTGQFFEFLAQKGISLVELSRTDSFKIQKRWTSIFARFKGSTRHCHGARAVAKFLDQTDGELILLFLSSRIQAFPLHANPRSCSAFEYAGPKVDLSEYHDLEFAVFPDTYAWSLVHTHEDFSLGGPYFIRSSDIE